jgi:hypothetical protein
MSEAIEQPAVEGSSADESSPDDRLLSALYGEEQPQDDVEQEQPEQAGEQAKTEAEQAAAELAEVEFGGKQYKLPPELKDALMAQSDYTQKTQEVAEQRRLVDLQATTLKKQSQFQKEVAPELQTLGHLDLEIAKYQKLDWASLDTDTLMRARMALDQLKDQKTQVQSEVQKKAQEFEQGMNQLRQQSIEKGNEYLKKVIPAWGPEIQKQIIDYGLKEGYSGVELDQITDPRVIKALWKSSQWDKLQSQKGATQQKVSNVPPVKKPGASIPTTNAQRDKAYKQALKGAKTNTDKVKIIDQRLAEKFFG